MPALLPSQRAACPPLLGYKQRQDSLCPRSHQGEHGSRKFPPDVSWHSFDLNQFNVFEMGSSSPLKAIKYQSTSMVIKRFQSCGRHRDLDGFLQSTDSSEVSASSCQQLLFEPTYATLFLNKSSPNRCGSRDEDVRLHVSEPP